MVLPHPIDFWNQINHENISTDVNIRKYCVDGTNPSKIKFKGFKSIVKFHLWESDVGIISEEISGCVPLFKWLAKWELKIRCGRSKNYMNLLTTQKTKVMKFLNNGGTHLYKLYVRLMWGKPQSPK